MIPNVSITEVMNKSSPASLRGPIITNIARNPIYQFVHKRALELLSQSGILSFTVITAMTKNNSAIPPIIMNCGARLG